MTLGIFGNVKFLWPGWWDEFDPVGQDLPIDIAGLYMGKGMCHRGGLWVKYPRWISIREK
jgi:hypothetical protein